MLSWRKQRWGRRGGGGSPDLSGDCYQSGRSVWPAVREW